MLIYDLHEASDIGNLNDLSSGTQTLYAEDAGTRDDWMLAINDMAQIMAGARKPLMVADRYKVR